MPKKILKKITKQKIPVIETASPAKENTALEDDKKERIKFWTDMQDFMHRERIDRASDIEFKIAEINRE